MSKDSDLFTQPSRIDIIGQNEGDGEHYMHIKYALQTNFTYGWDYIGTSDEDGLREIFDTQKEANDQLLEIIAFTNENITDYRVVEYNYKTDDSFARLPEEI